MEILFSLNNLFTLAMLTRLQAVFGFDNLLYISIESKRAPQEEQAVVATGGLELPSFSGLVYFLFSLILSIISRTLFLEIHLSGIIDSSLNLPPY